MGLDDVQRGILGAMGVGLILIGDAVTVLGGLMLLALAWPGS